MFGKVVILASFVLVSGCQSIVLEEVDEQNSDVFTKSIKSCIVYHQQGNQYDLKSDIFSVIDAVGLNYYILINGELTQSKFRQKYCHLDKASLKLLYGNNPNFNLNLSSEEYQKRYGGLISGSKTLGQVKLLRYKRIATQWRYLEIKAVNSL